MDDPRLASSRLHASVERLKAQVGLSWSKEATALAGVGLCDGMSILDAGSGPGFFSQALLDAWPHCTVTAVELDPLMCDVARSSLSADLGVRAEVVEASILHTDLPDDAFDFAVARFVLQHVASAELAISEILRLLKPGGCLAILDVDDGLGGIVMPRLAAFDVVGRKVGQIQAGRGGDRTIGRKLWRMLADAGYVDLGLGTLLIHSDELGLGPFLPQYAPERFRPFILTDGLTQDEWDSYADAFATFVGAPDAYILQLIWLASARKPVCAAR